MKVINMGLNTEPYWTKYEEVNAHFEQAGDSKAVEIWNAAVQHSLMLRDSIIHAVEDEGMVELNWTCTGATRFNIHANQWASAMPEYDFDIARYSCIVKKKEEVK